MGQAALRRVYFALWPDEALRAAIVAATADAAARAGGRTVPAADLHVTLAFLGEQPVARVDAAVAAARRTSAAPGVQRFDRVAAWGRGGPLVLEAAGVSPALATLQRALGNALDAADFQLDRREYRPHITLARALARRPAPVAASFAASVEWAFQEFVLVESRAVADGSRYAVVERFPLR